MHEIEEWLNQAATALGFSLRRKEPEEGRQIVEKAKADFVDGDPRAWWLSLKLPCKQYSSENTRLADLIPKNSPTCLLIPETDSKDLPVFEIDSEQIESLLKECPYFEYYVMAPDFGWLAAESDHNVFFVCERQ